MRYFLGMLILILATPIFAASQTTQQFIQKIAPLAQSRNAQILQNRQKLLNLYHQFKAGKQLGTSNWEWVDGIAHYYGLKKPDFTKDATWKKLLDRVNVIPTSLVVAQAAMESAWGRSRFAKQANNFFGQHCYTKGCGLVPKRASNAGFYVQSFPDAQAAVNSYMHNLNTQRSYADLRGIRSNLAQKNSVISGRALATGLQHYSELDGYSKHIQNIIAKYKLSSYDNSFHS